LKKEGKKEGKLQRKGRRGKIMIKLKFKIINSKGTKIRAKKVPKW
jgi:hypothetical protein